MRVPNQLFAAIGIFLLSAGGRAQSGTGFKKDPMGSGDKAKIDAVLPAANHNSGTNLHVDGTEGNYTISGSILGMTVPTSGLYTSPDPSQGGSGDLSNAGEDPNTHATYLSVSTAEMMSATDGRLVADLLHEALHLAIIGQWPDFARNKHCTGCVEQVVSCSMAQQLCGMAGNCSVVPLSLRADLASEADAENKKCKELTDKDACSSSGPCNSSHPSPASPATQACSPAACN